MLHRLVSRKLRMLVWRSLISWTKPKTSSKTKSKTKRKHNVKKSKYGINKLRTKKIDWLNFNVSSKKGSKKIVSVNSKSRK